MSGSATKRMLTAYFQDAQPTRFLTSFFSNVTFHDSETVEIDIERGEEDIAVVITDTTTGANVNSFDGYTNKEFTPPAFDEEGVVNAYSLNKRQAGQNPFVEPDFQSNAIVQAFKIFRKLEAKVRRAIEQMASQVLQTGQLSLADKAGAVRYTLDYKPKTTHFPTVGVSWTNAVNAVPLTDIASLADVIRTDGLSTPRILVFGADAWVNFLNTDQVKEALNNRRIETGMVAPVNRGEGAVFQGFIWIGNYRYEMWTYDGRYKDPATSNVLPFVDANNVIVMAEGFRGDLTFGSIPLIGSMDSRVLPLLPTQLRDRGTGMGMTTNAWLTEDRKHLKVSAGTRPLVIPVSIDRFGCLDTIV